MTGDEERLYQLMSDLSEDVYCAGWISDNEGEIWRLLHGQREWFGMYSASELVEELEAIRTLATQIDRWIVWRNGPVAIPLDEWIRQFGTDAGVSPAQPLTS